MPFALTIIGMLLIVTGFQNTYAALGAQVAGDFTGKNNFIYWFVAIAVVGAIGYAKPLQNFSRAFMALIIVSIFLSNKGFFTKFNAALSSGSAPADTTVGVPLSGSGGASSGGSSIGSSLLNSGVEAAVSSFL